MKSKMRVLVTCAGSGVAQSVVDSLKHLKDEYFLVTSDQGRYRYAVPDCDAFVELPSISDEDYVRSVQDVCKRMQIDVLIPGHDQELELFSHYRAAFIANDTQVPLSGYDLIKLLRNKLEWAKAFREKTDVVVQSLSVSDVKSGQYDMTFPMIAKPSGGSASSGLHILHSAEDANGLPDDVVVQTFLFPPSTDPDFHAVSEAVKNGRILQVSEISVQLVYSETGTLMGRFASVNRLKGGVPVEVIPLDDPDIWSAVKEIEGILVDMEPRGPINIQGRMTDAGLVFFEMNPRFTGITGNRAQFGFNEVDAVCRNFAREAMPKLLINYDKVGVRQVACRTWPSNNFAFPSTLNSSQNIVILGGTSWLGRTFIELCAPLGKKVIVISRLESLKAAQEQFSEIAHVDVLCSADSSAINALGWADALINLASARPPSGSDGIRESHDFQINWLTRAAIAQVPLILNVSSQSVYKNVQDDNGWSEGSDIDTSSPYSFSKYAIEGHLASLQRICPEMAVVSLRIGRLFGPAEGLRQNEFPHRCVSNAISNDEIVVSAPQTVLDLLDIRDAANALLHFMSNAPIAESSIYNIGSTQRITISDFVNFVQTAGVRLNFPGMKISEAKSTENNLEIGGYMDCAKALEAGWRPQFTLGQTIDALFERLSES